MICGSCGFVDHSIMYATDPPQYKCEKYGCIVSVGDMCKKEIYESKNDQLAKADFGKAQLTLVPRQIIWAIAKVRMYGVNIKYPETGRDGWKTISKERIQDAMYRHMLKYLENPDGVDKESGLPHLWHLATNVAFLCEMEKIESEKNHESIS